MSAVLKPKDVSLPTHAPFIRQRQSRHRRTELRSVSTSTPATFPLQPLKRPLWLKLLIASQRISFAVAVLTVVGTLFTYALTVNTNRRLAKATTSLEHLQEQQQQLTTANAVFKNHLAQVALSASENGALHPRDVIFLETIQPAISPEEAQPTPPHHEAKDKRFFPKGY